MGDAEGGLPPSKKRLAAGQLSRDNPGLDNDGPMPEMGTFQRASDDVLATRRIVEVCRHQSPAAAASSSNPFTGIYLVPPTDSNEKTTNTTTQTQPITDKDVLEAQDGTNIKHEKTDENKGTKNGVGEDGQNGKEEKNNRLENKTNVSEAEGSDEDKKDAVEEASRPGEADKEAENGGQGTEKEARAATEEEVGGEIEKEAREENFEEVRDESEEVDQDQEQETLSHQPGEEKVNNGQKDTAESATPLSSFQQLSRSQNAFTGLAGTGFSSSSFTFGSISKEGSSFSTGSLTEPESETPSHPSFSIGSSNNGSSSLQLSGAAKSRGSSIPSMQEVPVETGEENEKVVFKADAILFKYLDGGWKERGKGELRVNISKSGAERGRLVMRAKGYYRLVLNASLYPDMLLTNMEKKGITFACVNSVTEGNGELATFALKFKDGSIAEEFCGAVTAHKGKKATLPKTPENSPKALDD